MPSKCDDKKTWTYNWKKNYFEITFYKMTTTQKENVDKESQTDSG